MSHNNMATWFSGTDMSTLQEEGSYKNNFVSLIVNNAGKYTAAITRHVYSEIENNITFTYEMFGDGTKSGKAKDTKTHESIEYFMMDVHKPELPQNELDGRINEIIENKRKASVNVTYKPYNPSYASHGVVNSVYEQPSEDPDDNQMLIPWEEREFSMPHSTVKHKINENGLTVVMARLLTGNITCNEFKVDIDSWISNYDKVYASKFNDLVDYSEWLSPYLEYLMYHIPGEDTDIINDVAVAAYANEIINRIGTPKGPFSKELIEQLNFYGRD